VQNGFLVVKEELWLKTPCHVVQLPRRSTKCQKNISTTFSSLSMADLEFDDAFWVNHIPAAGCLTYSSGMKV